MQKIKQLLSLLITKNTFKYKCFEFQDPVFLSVFIYIILLYDYSGFMRLSFLASVLHETGHILFFVIFCKKMPIIRVTSTGFCMKTKGLFIPSGKMFCVALAGPSANFIIAISCYFLLLSDFTLQLAAFTMANFLLGIFNLLPFSPFDGEVMLKILAQKLLFSKK